MHLREETMSLDSSSEDLMYYLKIKDLEKELLFGGNVAPAPPGKYFLKHTFVDMSARIHYFFTKWS